MDNSNANNTLGQNQNPYNYPQNRGPNKLVKGIIFAVSGVIISVIMLAAGIFIGRMSMTSKPDANLDMIYETYDIIKQYNISEVDSSKLAENATWGMVSSLEDPYSYLFSPEELKEYEQEREGNYVGIGISAFLDEDSKQIIISRVYPKSPAARAFIEIGDVITEVDGLKSTGSNFDDILTKVRGKEGTTVKITFIRNGTTYTYSLKREVVLLDMVENKMIGDTAYIKIEQFNGNCDTRFEQILKQLYKDKVKNLVIDLRGNPGGDLEKLRKMADLLLPKGNIISYHVRGEEPFYYESDAQYYKFNLAVLVDENSASASEAFAGAIQDYGVGKIVGTKTFGKGIMQQHFNLSNGYVLKITTSYYYLPKGRNIHKQGITPDVTVKLEKKSDILTPENDTQLQKALELIKSK